MGYFRDIIFPHWFLCILVVFPTNDIFPNRTRNYFHVCVWWPRSLMLFSCVLMLHHYDSHHTTQHRITKMTTNKYWLLLLALIPVHRASIIWNEEKNIAIVINYFLFFSFFSLILVIPWNQYWWKMWVQIFMFTERPSRLEPIRVSSQARRIT